MRTHLTRILSLLEEVYGIAHRDAAVDPVAILIGCILSQNTSDANAHRAHQALIVRYGTYDALLRASQPELAATIRCGGLAEAKSRAIMAALGSLASRGNGVGLDFLTQIETQDAMRLLVSIPGIGCKTAAIVLNFGFGRPVLPVDTHVYRLLLRLGLVSPTADPCRASETVSPEIDPGQVYRFHIALLRHGKRCCKARSPRCDLCTLSVLCPQSSVPRPEAGEVAPDGP